MPIAFVLINSEAGTEKEILKELKSIKEVKEAYVVYGTYDVIAKVRCICGPLRRRSAHRVWRDI